MGGLTTIWNSLTNTGVEYAETPSEKRSVFLSNAISVSVAAMGFVLFFVYYIWYGWSVITVGIPLIALFSLSTLIFNYWNLSVVSRFWVCLFVPVTTMVLSLYAKTLYYHRQEELDYFTFRIVMLSACVLPPVFFSIKERAYLAIGSLSVLAILMLHDPLHSYFGVPYKQNTLKESNYAFTNVVILMTYLLMSGAVIFMKWISEVNEGRANSLIEELNSINNKLQGKNQEIEVRNAEISKQAEDIIMSRQKLTAAYNIIEEQRNLLFQQNKNLSSELLEKNRELTETNHELIKHNNELRQFSYTVSHNLRGPVASLMGLLKLFESTDLPPENREIFGHIEASTLRLDNIIKDLSKIIDIRHDIFHIRQQINLEHEVEEIRSMLDRDIEAGNISLVVNLAGSGIVYSVRPMVHSILYNLVSNAIKYRSPDRAGMVQITSSEDEKYYLIEVSDNGLGIDLNRDRENLFKLYKRFHHHTEGKGLGLYLVKLQAEALGGSVSVHSELNRFTTFTVRLRKPENAERQILYHESFAEIFFDARLNCIGTVWRERVTKDQYRSATRKIFDFIQTYNTPNYLSDFSIGDTVQNFNLENIFTHKAPDASTQGLSRIGVVVPGAVGPDKIDIRTRMKSYGITLEFFATTSKAIAWIEEQNARSLLNAPDNG